MLVGVVTAASLWHVAKHAYERLLSATAPEHGLPTRSDSSNLRC